MSNSIKEEWASFNEAVEYSPSFYLFFLSYLFVICYVADVKHIHNMPYQCHCLEINCNVKWGV